MTVVHTVPRDQINAGGPGPATCTCGVSSGELPSMRARRAWVRQHRAAERAGTNAAPAAVYGATYRAGIDRAADRRADIAQHVAAHITTHQRPPTVTELAARYGVTRKTIDTDLDVLAEHGAIVWDLDSGRKTLRVPGHTVALVPVQS